MTNWSDTPPTKAGDYWVKRRSNSEEQIGTLDGENWYFKWPYEDWFPADNPDEFQFGPRIPAADELVELPGLIDEYGSWMLDADTKCSQLCQDKADAVLARINAILGVAE